ncbi:MAG: helix-turn-helix transcriptional regulator [Verrucomicrobia bacterium]|nr:helix-turn-helix transcriptional regulator [Verrucomicrobiota bacterium]
MKAAAENRAEMRKWLERMLHWIERGELPAIPFAGWTTSGYANRPAPNIELVYMEQGHYDKLLIGDRKVCFPQGHVALHNIHFGNYAPREKRAIPFNAWCLFLKLPKGMAEFKEMESAPVFCSIPVNHSKRMAARFRSVSDRCLEPRIPRPTDYSEAQIMYDPLRPAPMQNLARIRVKAALLDLLAELLDEVGTAEEKTPMPEGVRQAMIYMEQNYMNPNLSLSDLTVASGMSRSRLGTIFRSSAGVTPMQYLRNLRLTQSRRLLKQTDLRIAEISAHIGFSDALYFSRIFRLETGCSPGQYRA